MPRKKDAPQQAGPEPSFEDRLEALEGVVQDLEGEELPLEASIARYQEGVEHLRACRALLDAAERRLVELVDAGGGQAEERHLDLGPEKGNDAGRPA